MPRNKLHTPSYFIKRLRESSYRVGKVFSGFGPHDPRRWTVVINPGTNSVFITCYTNKVEYNDCVFEINDGGKTVPKNFQLQTKSIEVLVNYLRDYQIYGDAEPSSRKEDDQKEAAQEVGQEGD